MTGPRRRLVKHITGLIVDMDETTWDTKATEFLVDTLAEQGVNISLKEGYDYDIVGDQGQLSGLQAEGSPVH